MSTATVVFLVIGGFGALLLAVALLGAELLHVAHLDLPDLFSLEAIAGFLGTLGFGGAVASELLRARTPATVVVATAVGVAAAVPAAYLAVRLSRAARNMRTDATPTRVDLVGTLGVVVTPIPQAGYGEVRVRLGGQPVKLYARADGPIPVGTGIFVVEAASDTSVVVEPIHPVT